MRVPKVRSPLAAAALAAAVRVALAAAVALPLALVAVGCQAPTGAPPDLLLPARDSGPDGPDPSLDAGHLAGDPAEGADGPTDRWTADADGPREAQDGALDQGAPTDAARDGSQTPSQADRAVWRPSTLYLVMLDRFANGDPGNDELGKPGCWDPGDPRAFHGGDLAGLRARIPYLRELGVDALWVTPLNRQAEGPPQSPCAYHGYWADFTEPDDGALEPRFGTAAELLALREDLTAQRVRLVLDMVVNHPGDHARIVSQHPEWFHPAATCAEQGNPAVDCPYRSGISDFAQERAEVAAYLDALGAGWVRRFGLDGIRMDTAKYVAPSYFAEHWVPAVRAARGDLFLVAEVFSETRSELVPYLDAGFDATFHFPRRAALRDTFARGGSVDLVAAAVRDDLQSFGLERTLDLVTFLDNHDVKRFVNEPGLGVSEVEIGRRYRLALAALFTAPGIPQLYMGDELGLYGGDDPDNRRDMPAWAWQTADRAGAHPGVALPDAAGTFAHVQRLIALRSTTAALHSGRYVELWRQNGAGNPNVWAFFRGSGESRALVVMNAGTQPAGPVAIPVQANADLTPADRAALADGVLLEDQLGAGAPATVTVTGGTVTVQLPAGAAGIYLLPVAP